MNEMILNFFHQELEMNLKRYDWQLEELKERKGIFVAELKIIVNRQAYHLIVLDKFGQEINMKKNGETHRIYIFMCNYIKKFKNDIQKIDELNDNIRTTIKF